MVGRDVGAPDAEEGEITALQVAVEHDMLVRALVAAATEQRLLTALAMALIV